MLSDTSYEGYLRIQSTNQSVFTRENSDQAMLHIIRNLLQILPNVIRKTNQQQYSVVNIISGFSSNTILLSYQPLPHIRCEWIHSTLELSSNSTSKRI